MPRRGLHSARGAHILGEGPEVRGDCGERPEAQEGVQVQDCHAAAARQLEQLHAEPGDVHHRLDHGGDQGCQVVAQPLHVPRQPLVHILAEQRAVSDAGLHRTNLMALSILSSSHISAPTVGTAIPQRTTWLHSCLQLR